MRPLDAAGDVGERSRGRIQKDLRELKKAMTVVKRGEIREIQDFFTGIIQGVLLREFLPRKNPQQLCL